MHGLVASMLFTVHVARFLHIGWSVGESWDLKAHSFGWIFVRFETWDFDLGFRVASDFVT